MPQSISQLLRPTPRAVFMSSFVPRECGLATFTEDVLNAVSSHGMSCKVIAMNRPGQCANYDRRVIATVQENRFADYLAAAALINAGNYDVLSVQHEFGLFGGENCDYLAQFLAAVQIPIVTTFHTILRKPSAVMRENLRAVAARSDAIVVMNSLAIELLEKVYGLRSSNIMMIHHGAPVVPRGRRYTMKSDLNLRGARVISTFGLLSSGKGLEYAVKAMPHIIADCPDAMYLILGQTHPVIKQQEGECYRESLITLASELGVLEHVRFVDKFFTKAELVAYLLATDVYLTPYLNLEQVTSGTLAYAMACGRPLVSTPYLYAQFLLGEDRGLLVRAQDEKSIANACVAILSDAELQLRMERMNWRYGQTMLWPRVGQDYLRLFTQLSRASVPAVSYAQSSV